MGQLLHHIWRKVLSTLFWIRVDGCLRLPRLTVIDRREHVIHVPTMKGSSGFIQTLFIWDHEWHYLIENGPRKEIQAGSGPDVSQRWMWILSLLSDSLELCTNIHKTSQSWSTLVQSGFITPQLKIERNLIPEPHSCSIAVLFFNILMNTFVCSVLFGAFDLPLFALIYICERNFSLKVSSYAGASRERVNN